MSFGLTDRFICTPEKTFMATSTKTARTDIYTRVTDSIVVALSPGVRPWLKPWRCEHTAGHITHRLRHNGTPYKGH